MENQEKKHKRRVRYSGAYPKSYKEKYKELNPEKYADTVSRVIQKGSTPAGMHISICVSENHKTTENILKKGAFTVSMADVEHMTACDYVGIVSGNKEPDKFVKAGFTAEKSEKVDAPIIKELPICIECKLKSYDKDTCRLIGEIVNVSVDESVLDENGNVDVAKAAPITFDPFNNAYIRLGEKVGDAFKAGTALK
mgnify:CR=1 FL=1